MSFPGLALTASLYAVCAVEKSLATLVRYGSIADVATLVA